MDFNVTEAVELIVLLAETEQLTLQDALHEFLAETELDSETASHLKGALFEKYSLKEMATDAVTDAMMKVFVTRPEVKVEEEVETPEGNLYFVEVDLGEEVLEGYLTLEEIHELRESEDVLSVTLVAEGVRDTDAKKGTEERKKRLEKKRGMKLDDHPQYLETDMKKRQSNNEKARKDMEKMGSMKNPAFEGYEISEGRKEGESAKDYAARMTKKYSGGKSKTYDPMKDKNFDHDKAERTRGSMEEGLDPVGKSDADIDNDGDVDKSDKYLHNRRKAIGNAMGKKKAMREGKMSDEDIKKRVGYTSDETRQKRLDKIKVKFMKKEETEVTEGIRDLDPEKGTKERKARLEKKHGMKLDDHPQFKKEGYDSELGVKEKARKNAPKSGEANQGMTKKQMEKEADQLLSYNKNKTKKKYGYQESYEKAIKANQKELDKLDKGEEPATAKRYKEMKKESAWSEYLSRRGISEEVFSEGDLVDAGRKNQGERDRKKITGEGVDNSTSVKLMPRISESAVITEKAESKSQQRLFGMVRAAQKGEKPASGKVAELAAKVGKKDVLDFAKTKHKGIKEECCDKCGTPECTCEGKKDKKKKAKLDEAGMPILEYSRNNAGGPTPEMIDPSQDVEGEKGVKNPKGKAKRPKAGDRRPNVGGPDLPFDGGTVGGGCGC